VQKIWFGGDFYLKKWQKWGESGGSARSDNQAVTKRLFLPLFNVGLTIPCLSLFSAYFACFLAIF
jgi:hypothetical protein